VMVGVWLGVGVQVDVGSADGVLVGGCVGVAAAGCVGMAVGALRRDQAKPPPNPRPSRITPTGICNRSQRRMALI
jgi:hypothetical protein